MRQRAARDRRWIPGPHAGGRALLPAAACLLLAAPAWAGSLVQVRVGNHPTFTRVVFEFDAPTGYQVERREAEGTEVLVVTLDASSAPRQITSHSPGVEAVQVEEVAGRTVARVLLRDPERRLKEMILTSPPRVVLDLVDEQAEARIAAAKKQPAPSSKPKPAAKPKPVAEKPAEAKPIAKPAAEKPAPERRAAAPLSPAPKPQPAQIPEPPPPAETVARAPEPPAPPPVAPATAPATEPEQEIVEAAPESAEPEVAEREAPPAEPALEPVVAVAEPEPAPEQIAEAEPLPEPAEQTEAEEGFAPSDEDDELAEAEKLAPAPPAEPPSTAPRRVAVVEPEASADESWALPFDPVRIAPYAAGALVALLLLVFLARRRRALPSDVVIPPAEDAPEPEPELGARAAADSLPFAADESEVAAEESEHGRIPAGGFSMDAPPPSVAGAAREAGGSRAPEPGPRGPSGSSPAPAAPPAPAAEPFAADKDKDKDEEKEEDPMASLFDDTPEGEPMMMNQEASDLPTRRGDPHAATQPTLAHGISAGGDSDVSQAVSELERRLAMLETRLEESIEARERLERQVAAQSEELRVQRAAIARTQRALRSLSRGEDEQATEPAPRDPSTPSRRG